MSVSSGNLNSLLNTSFPVENLGGVAVQSYTATGTPFTPQYALSSVTVDTTGGPGLGTADGVGETAKIAAVNDSTDTITVVLSLNGIPEAQLTEYVLGYTANAMLVGGNNANTIGELLGAGDDVDYDLSVLSPAPIPAGTPLAFTSDGTFTASLACFAAGTRLAVGDGETAVEHLREGGMVRLAGSGDLARVRWIGHRRIDLERHPDPDSVRPVRIRAGAFADGVPSRDLLLSPDHAVLCGGTLIPVRMLANGATILPDSGCRDVCYYHVELERHGILLAENLPAESYLDTGNRCMFANSGLPILLHPDPAGCQARRERGSAAPFADDPARVGPVWRGLAGRAALLGHRLPPEPRTTADPAVSLLADGRRMAPVETAGGRFVFLLPDAGAAVRLMSRSAVPGKLRPWTGDGRRLGVCVRGLTLRRGAAVLPIPLDHPAFGDGWWQPERPATGSMLRWTDGDAAVPLAAAGLAGQGPCLLEIETAGTLPYVLDSLEAERAVA
jgi:hypothetical protein